MRRVLMMIAVLWVSASVDAATLTWTGATSNLWSIGTNWSGGVAPSNGDDLIFPATGANQTNSDDLAAGLNLHSITISGGNYSISGNAITLGAGGIIYTDTDNVSSIANPITLATDETWSLDSASHYVGVSGSLDLNGHALTLNFIGTVEQLDAAITGAGSIAISAVSGSGVRLGGNDTTTAPLTSNGFVDVENAYDGPITMTGLGELIVEDGGTVGNVTISPGASYLGGPNPGGTAHTGNLTLLPSTDSGSSIFVGATNGSAPGQFTQTNVTGTVTLNSPILLFLGGVSLPAGTSLTLINNDGTDPVSGTFNSLPEGAMFLSNVPVQEVYKISYAGGDGNDVVVTNEGTTPVTTTTVTSSENPAIVGDAVTFNVTVSSTQGIPQGVVDLNDGITTIASIFLDATGQGSFTTSALAVGMHTITAQYRGVDSTTLGASTSAPLSQEVDVPPFAIPMLDPRVLILLAIALATVGAAAVSASAP
ncbi:MAG TPA: Ig-like domain-containing protein [Thermoanaerobaculia bacterium]|nr:Ig-like domain-containing protein [Thermoanaerobaculia bacterium]